jgi:hypothetical protein
MLRLSTMVVVIRPSGGIADAGIREAEAIVKVGPDAGLRLQDAAMEEPQGGVERLAAEHREEVRATGSAMFARRGAIARRIVVRDALLERQTRRIGCRVERGNGATALLRQDSWYRRPEHD